jgi:hypothetical protein
LPVKQNAKLQILPATIEFRKTLFAAGKNFCDFSRTVLSAKNTLPGERGYKWQAYEKWNAQLNPAEYQSLLEKTRI